MKKTLSANQQIIHIGEKLNEKGFISAYGGNISVRIGNRITITPTRFSLAELTEEDLVVVDLNGNVHFGMNQPSSEMELHLNIYRTRPEINGIVHTHPPASTAFAYSNAKIVPLSPESVAYIHHISIVPFFPVGSPELAKAVGEVMMSAEEKVVLLERHGLVCVGTSLYEAYNLTELAEETAMMNLYVRLLGI